MQETVRTQVGIVGAGPAGLLLAQLLTKQGVDSVLIESRTREYCETRVRAGVLEYGTVELLKEAGAAERLEREGLQHNGVYQRVRGIDHHIHFRALTGGKTITVYAQQELVKDLIALRLRKGSRIVFEAENATVHQIEGPHPHLSCRIQGGNFQIHCDFIAGCDGFHGISRPSIPEGVLQTFDTTYPFAWLGILAQVAPSSHELVYASHDRGFALLSMRTPEISRLYLQCEPDEDPEAWSDDRIWSELQTRLVRSDGWTLKTRSNPSKRRNRNAQLRSRADAIRPAFPRRRRSAHRSPRRVARGSTSPQPTFGFFRKLSPVSMPRATEACSIAIPRFACAAFGMPSASRGG